MGDSPIMSGKQLRPGLIQQVVTEGILVELRDGGGQRNFLAPRNHS